MDDLETTANPGVAPGPQTGDNDAKPVTPTDMAPPAGKPRNTRAPKPEEHPLNDLRERIAKEVAQLLKRQYGVEGRDTIKSVTTAIRRAGALETNRIPFVVAIADAATSKLIERRGERDLGLATRMGAEIRGVADR